MQVKVGKVSCPTANVSQILEKVSESEKVCLFWHLIHFFFPEISLSSPLIF